jgi:Tfp pilus assembly protein PilO
MKASSSTRAIVAILIVVGLAVAFWMLLLSPKREKSDELSLKAEQLQSTLASNQSAVLSGEEAQKEFPTNYQQLVVLGKAVPVGDESASLLVQLNHVADRAHVKFQSLLVGTGNGSEAQAPPEEPAPAPEGEAEGESSEPPAEESAGVPASSVAPTEAATSAAPIGATVGPAGLNTLPYDLTFSGSFFHVADFIHGIDSLIHTSGNKVAVDGRLVTLDGFALAIDGAVGFPRLSANFSVTTYLVPPGQGLTAGASPAEPSGAEAPSTVANELR